MKKLEAYRSLVDRRKKCSICKGLCNPAVIDNGRYDQNHIGPWSLWQGNLDADLVVVGQDWGDVGYFRKWEGKDQPSGNPTNENLRELLKVLGIEIGKPRDEHDQVVFLTNLILCLKTGGLQAPVRDEWFMNCTRHFFEPLIEIINPRAIIALGKKSSESILALYGIKYSRSALFSSMVEGGPYFIDNTTALFPVYHCGAGSVNRNRSMSQQKRDWSRIAKWLSHRR